MQVLMRIIRVPELSKGKVAFLLIISIALICLVGVWSNILIVGFGHGESMEPNIEHGDIIVSSSYTSYEVGDVICFESKLNEQNSICHRVIDINNDTVITKGDNNPISDPPIDKDDVERTVLFSISIHNTDIYQKYIPNYPIEYEDRELQLCLYEFPNGCSVYNMAILFIQTHPIGFMTSVILFTIISAPPLKYIYKNW